MGRMFPSLYPTLFYRSGVVTKASSVSELGIYGTFLGNAATDKVRCELFI